MFSEATFKYIGYLILHGPFTDPPLTYPFGPLGVHGPLFKEPLL